MQTESCPERLDELKATSLGMLRVKQLKLLLVHDVDVVALNGGSRVCAVPNAVGTAACGQVCIAVAVDLARPTRRNGMRENAGQSDEEDG